MKLPSSDKNVIDSLRGYPMHILLYVLGLGGCLFLSIIGASGKTPYIDVIAAILISIIIITIAGFSYFSHKDSTEKISKSLDDLKGEVNGMSIHLREMNEQLKLTDLGDTLFNKEAFYKVWKKLTVHTENQFLTMSYMCPESWTDEKAMSQIAVLGNLKTLSDSHIVVRRLFVVDDEDELKKLVNTFNEHLNYQIDIRWILKKTIMEKNIFPNQNTDPGFTLSDDNLGAIYYYDSNRKIANGKLIFKPAEVKMYLHIFDECWKQGKAISRQNRNIK